MSPIYLVRWGATKYIVSRYSGSLLMFPALAALPRFEVEADAISYCNALNSNEIAPIHVTEARDLELRRAIARDLCTAS